MNIDNDMNCSAVIAKRCFDEDLNCYAWVAENHKWCTEEGTNTAKYCEKSCQKCGKRVPPGRFSTSMVEISFSFSPLLKKVCSSNSFDLLSVKHIADHFASNLYNLSVVTYMAI